MLSHRVQHRKHMLYLFISKMRFSTLSTWAKRNLILDLSIGLGQAAAVALAQAPALALTREDLWGMGREE